jgi:hypothetical protein
MVSPSITPAPSKTAVLSATPTTIASPAPIDPRAQLAPGIYLAYWRAAGLYLASLNGPLNIRLAPINNKPSLSPDGDRIAFKADSRLHIYDLPTGTDSSLSGLNLYSEDLYFGGSPTWAPDGRMIVYASPTIVVISDTAQIDEFPSL